MNDEALHALLSEIEARELPLLTWGVTTGTYTDEELVALLTELAPGEDPEDVLDTLTERRLLVTHGLARPVYRTRMAETVRLAVNLRQWFHGGDWRTAKTLVSDVRFMSRVRTVPRRDRSAADATDRLRRAMGTAWTDRHGAALTQILGGRQISAFQETSAARLLTPAAASRGTVVTAGTGAGKTLAFYLPVLTHLLATPRPGKSPRVVAIYPRTELLRDQLRNLLLQTRSLAGAPPISVGVLYGSTPYDRDNAATDRRRGWRVKGDALVSPILQCLEDTCGGDYVWRAEDRTVERLTCERCGSTVGPPHLQFTRKSLLSAPPTILFTTTEMVNRLLGTRSRRLLLGEGDAGPEFLLLDEIHTYSGTHGAQVANLLRRWRAGIRSSPHIVGLSATLADPVEFFSALTGLQSAQVGSIGPRQEDMKPVGREYFLALRGDPASQTSLLSTTIQASMLMRRMLDVEPGTPSQRAYGSKVFAFTDDLDVTNRLHAQLEDAEGWRSGGVNRKPQGSLAVLRAPGGPDEQLRDQAGQLWAFSQDIGTLQRPVRVARTTSRDSGVDTVADIVVATASLEVGFDDPNVGVVLQHKAPRNAAQFLQRRGRAGRDPVMRPWTVVVLSDFGRDRLAFQGYEALFDPIVRSSPLPVRNRVLLKMQATWHLAALLQLARTPRGAVAQKEQGVRLRRALAELMTEQGVSRLTKQLRGALQLDEEDVLALLWDYPRGLMTAVVPTLLRAAEALERGQAETEDPLRDFLPASLFAALQTPEVRLHLPGQAADDEGEPVAVALRQFAPGRVSYRYALSGRRDRLWVAPPASTEADLDLTGCFDGFELERPPSGKVPRLLQPTAMRLATPPGPTSDSAYGRWRWRSAFLHDGVPLRLDVPARSAWAPVVEALSGLTHRYRCPLHVWRYSTEVEVERNDLQEPVRTSHGLVHAGRATAVGFALDVDAVQARVRLPATPPADAAVVRALRVARFEHLARTDPSLSQAVPSHFAREWLQQVLLSALIASGHGSDLKQVLLNHSDDQLRTAVLDAAQQVFAADPNDPSASPGLVQDLDAALRTPGVLHRLRHIAEVLWAEPDDSWTLWLHTRYLTTLAAAMVQAIEGLCPDVDTDTLRCDVQIDDDGAGSVTISEDEPGGVGVVESLVDRYVEDPRAFWSLVTAALEPSDAERVDQTIAALLTARTKTPIASAMTSVRTATGLQALTSAWGTLRRRMFEMGLPSDPSVVSALATRLLRPGSSTQLDDLAQALLDRWTGLEESLGIEIELRVFAFVAATDPTVQRRLEVVTKAGSTSTVQAIGQVVGLLWARGGRVRAAALETYNPYVEQLPTERLLFQDPGKQAPTAVDMDVPGWRAAIDEQLQQHGRAFLRVGDEASGATAIADLLTEPTYVQVLEFHPRVVGVQRDPAGMLLTLELREAHQ